MNEDVFQELALELLSNLESWINHSDEYKGRLFSDENISDKAALDVVAWVQRQIEKPEQNAMSLFYCSQYVGGKEKTPDAIDDTIQQCLYRLTGREGGLMDLVNVVITPEIMHTVPEGHPARHQLIVTVLAKRVKVQG